MASSYYRRIHDANLRQGTKTDLTSARIYGTSARTEKENPGRKDARYPIRYESLIRIVVSPITIARK